MRENEGLHVRYKCIYSYTDDLANPQPKNATSPLLVPRRRLTRDYGLSWLLVRSTVARKGHYNFFFFANIIAR